MISEQIKNATKVRNEKLEIFNKKKKKMYDVKKKLKICTNMKSRLLQSRKDTKNEIKELKNELIKENENNKLQKKLEKAIKNETKLNKNIDDLNSKINRLREDKNESCRIFVNARNDYNSSKNSLRKLKRIHFKNKPAKRFNIIGTLKIVNNKKKKNKNNEYIKSRKIRYKLTHKSFIRKKIKNGRKIKQKNGDENAKVKNKIKNGDESVKVKNSVKNKTKNGDESVKVKNSVKNKIKNSDESVKVKNSVKNKTKNGDESVNVKNSVKNKTKNSDESEKVKNSVKTKQKINLNLLYKPSHHTNFKSCITNFHKFLNDAVGSIQEKCSVYKSQLLIGDVFYVLSKLVSNKGYTIAKANTDIKSEHIACVTDEAIIMKRSKIPNEILKELFEIIKRFVMRDIKSLKCDNSVLKGKRLLATDGSSLNLSEKCNLNYFGFKMDSLNKYHKILINGVYDIENDIPIDNKFTNNLSEMSTFMEQIDELPENGIILADGHYYSPKIVNKLKNKNIDCILRIPKNLVIIKNNLEKMNDDEIIVKIPGEKNNENEFRLIKYNQRGKEIYLGTSLLSSDEFNKNMIFEIYKNRWFIEEYFKLMKCSLNFKQTKSKLLNNILQEMYMNMIIVLIGKYMQLIGQKYNLLKKPLAGKYKINNNNFMHNIGNKFMKYMLYRKINKDNISDIEDLLYDIINVTFKIEDDRFELRERKTPINQYVNKMNK